MKKSRSPSAEGVTVSTLGYPSLIDQLFRYHRHSAALKPRVTSQVSARNRLMTSNQIEHYSAIDVASCFARCNLKVGQINLSHFRAPAGPSTWSLASPVLIKSLELSSRRELIARLLIVSQQKKAPAKPEPEESVRAQKGEIQT